MMEVHKKGRSIVAHGSKEQVEQHAVAMHGFGLWATVEKATGGARDGNRIGQGQGKTWLRHSSTDSRASPASWSRPSGSCCAASSTTSSPCWSRTTAAHEDPLAALVGLDMEAREPSDRALRRLLPNVMKDDAEASLEFRRLTERSLRESKIGALKAAALGLDKDELVLTPADARHWSTALNDVRLVLAERLDIRDERTPSTST